MMIICADDMGLTPQINHTILKLVKKCKINAVSCMVSGIKQEDIRQLKQAGQDLKIGMHFYLFDAPLLTSKSPLGESYLQVALKLIISPIQFRKKVNQEFQAQISQFKKLFGHYPDFYDGHCHIHQIPFLCTNLLHAIPTTKKSIFIRNTRNSLSNILLTTPYIGIKGCIKAIILSYAGSLYYQVLKKHKIPTNNYMQGLYSYNIKNDVKAIMNQYLNLAQANDLIAYHPGPLNELKGPNRKEEYHFLKERK